jgi:small subunit ribosomal protein S20
MKNCFSAVEAYSASPSPEAMTEVNTRMSAAYSKIDKAVKKGVLHRNNGAHKKSRLAQAVKTATAPAA